MNTIFKSYHLELLQKLISIKSITPTDAGALPLIIDYLTDFNATLKLFGDKSEEVLINY